MKFKLHTQALMLVSAILLIACGNSDGSYTLYRNSSIDEHMRIHVATFNAKDGHDYNMSNCQIAQELFQKQDGIKTKFWCEKGNFKK